MENPESDPAVEPEAETPSCPPCREKDGTVEISARVVEAELGSASVSSDLLTVNDEIARLLTSHTITQSQVSHLQNVLRENQSLKDKVIKLKSLLQKSSKATKDVKAELDAHRKDLDAAHAEITQLNLRLLAFSKRPTHLDLIADFDKNLERALCSIQNDTLTGGDDHSSFTRNNYDDTISPNTVEITQLHPKDEPCPSLIQEWKDRHTHMETIHASLLERLSILEQEKNEAIAVISHLKSDIRAVETEADHAKQAMNEMRLELDLITKSAVDANVRAAKGRQAAEHIKSDKARTHELRNQIQVLTEWATAEARAKQALIERNLELENQLAIFMGNQQGDTTSWRRNTRERSLWKTSSSVVIGAGMTHREVVDFGKHKLEDFETVVLRWQFNIIPQEMDILFSLVRGRLNDSYNINESDYMIRDRYVTNGAGGENEEIFAVR